MDRRDNVLKYITKIQRGIEIGPWFAPLTPKRDGYNCLTMDVFDSATLRKKAADSGSLSSEQLAQIEDVDVIGSSTHIDDAVAERHRLGEFAYIVSSHNFEHLPNPIRFLQGCAKVLAPGGMICMAIPDRRSCYDYFRPVTRLSDWLEGYLEDRSRPTLAQNFDNTWVRSSYDHHGVPFGSFFRGVSPTTVTATMSIEKDFERWLEHRKKNDTEYRDGHCSVFTPSSFELLIRDTAYLGLTSFEVVEITEGPGVEFFAHLRATDSPDALHPVDYEQIRDAILHRILDEASETSTLGFNAKTQPVVSAQPNFEVIAGLLGVDSSQPGQIAEVLAQRNVEHEAQQAQLAAANERISRLLAERAQIASADDRISRLLAEVAALRTSTSWKVTAPVRMAAIALRRFTQRH
jgi:predicted SAM-dependent methyltransferase